MSLAVAKEPKKPKSGGGEAGKRKPGRPTTDIETDSFCCRASVALIEAFTQLSKVTKLNKPGTELLRAAESHILRMYREVVADPQSSFIDQAHIPAFLEAAEAYLKEAKRWPLPPVSEG